MFGYLQIQKSELRVREYEAYKSVYCGLCKQMGKDYSFLSRFSLSYDCTFYVMLLMATARSCDGFRDGRCRFNPLKKCSFARCKDDAYSKASAFSVISAYYKVIDNINDSGFFKILLCRLVKPFFSRWRKKASKKYPELERYVSEMMTLQSEAEHKKDCCIDEAAHPTGYMIGSVFALEAKDELEKRVYYEFGYHIGRWIYLVDAADDIEKDKKHNCFNPFLKNGLETRTQEEITAILNQSLARAYEAYNLLEIIDFKGILDNMMVLGFPASQNRIFEKKNTEGKNE